MTPPTRYFGNWGNVPADPDVRPFSLINPVRSGKDRKNHKHHFVSATYMDGFADARGRVQAYHAGQPERPSPTQPTATGYENFYYSQPLLEGGRENHRFEDLWNCVETVWSDTMRALGERRISPAVSFNVLGMLTIMRVRVPAARDRTAVMLEAKLRSQYQTLEEYGMLPAEFERYAGRFEEVPVGINPHHTLFAMNEQFREMGNLAFGMGFEVLHNRTETPFITSDNPVCFYDPRRSPAERLPYETEGEIELVFPLTANMMLRGTTARRPVNTISAHTDVNDATLVRRLNCTVAQFAYRMAIARDRSSDDIVAAHAGVVPTVTTHTRRHGKNIEIVVIDVFGQRPKLERYIDTPERPLALRPAWPRRVGRDAHCRPWHRRTLRHRPSCTERTLAFAWTPPSGGASPVTRFGASVPQSAAARQCDGISIAACRYGVVPAGSCSYVCTRPSVFNC
jgi:hypothetical protein